MRFVAWRKNSCRNKTTIDHRLIDQPSGHVTAGLANQNFVNAIFKFKAIGAE